MRNEIIVIFFSIKTSLYMYYLLTTIYAHINIQYYTLGCVIVKAVLAKQAPSMNANYIM